MNNPITRFVGSKIETSTVTLLEGQFCQKIGLEVPMTKM